MSKIIRDWGKFDDNGMFQYALNPLGFVCNPTDEQLTEAGYHKVVKGDKPEDPEGERARICPGGRLPGICIYQ